MYLCKEHILNSSKNRSLLKAELKLSVQTKNAVSRHRRWAFGSVQPGFDLNLKKELEKRERCLTEQRNTMFVKDLPEAGIHLVTGPPAPEAQRCVSNSSWRRGAAHTRVWTPDADSSVSASVPGLALHGWRSMLQTGLEAASTSLPKHLFFSLRPPDILQLRLCVYFRNVL